MANFQDNQVCQYQDVSILDFAIAKDDGGGGDNRSYQTCKAPVKLLPNNIKTQLFTGLTPFLLPKGKYHNPRDCPPKSHLRVSHLCLDH